MPLDRGILSEINQEILSALGDEEGSQLVRVPVSDAFWSTWRAYCDAVGIPMGRGVAALIAWELRSVVEEDLEQVQVLLREREGELADWEERVAGREKSLIQRERAIYRREERLEEWEARLREWGERLRAEEQRSSGQVPLPATLWPSLHARLSSQVPKVGRNDPCPCGSGEKYKRCHGR